MTVYAKTKKNAAALLDGTADYLASYGRTRKLPYKTRAAGHPYGPMSTLAALRFCARYDGFTPTARKAAENFLADALREDWPHTFNKCGGIQGVDDVIWDTRAVVRYLRRAARYARTG